MAGDHGHTDPGAGSLREIASLFLRLGVTAFGGPAAHIAMMHDEVVVRRKWISDEEFADLLGATNLIPGPNSTELAIHLGYRRGGWRGLVAAGCCFIVPAMLIVLALAVAYVEYGQAPVALELLYGVKPVIIAIIAQALWFLGRKVAKGWNLAVAGAVVAGYFAGYNEIALLLAAGLVVMAVRNRRALVRRTSSFVLLPMASLSVPGIDPGFSLGKLFLLFLKIGSVLYGSGYVLLAFLRADLVDRLGWLTDQQLIDAVAIGQLTPGPVFTTATFIGYVIGGVPGSVLATIGIFLPSFIFVAISNPFIPRMRRSLWFGGLLDGVNAASLGLMAAVSWMLGAASLVDPVSIGVGVVALVLLVRFRVNTTWLILGGALVGLAKGWMV